MSWGESIGVDYFFKSGFNRFGSEEIGVIVRQLLEAGADARLSARQLGGGSTDRAEPGHGDERLESGEIRRGRGQGRLRKIGRAP